MRLTLIRHAEPDWGPNGSLDIDPALTPLGHEQSKRVAARLAEHDAPDRLLVSTAQRALQTVAPIADALGMTPQVHDWLHELRIFDEFHGTPMDEYIDRVMPVEERPFPKWMTGADGTAELMDDFVVRVMAGMNRLLDGLGVQRTETDFGIDLTLPATDEHVMVVAHGGTMSTLITQLLGYPTTPWEWERLFCDYTGICRVETRPIANTHRWSLTLFNDLAHLS